MTGWQLTAHLLLLLTVGTLLASAKLVRLPKATTHKNSRLIQFTPDNQAQRDHFAQMQNSIDGPIFLQTSPLPNGTWLAVVSPKQMPRFRQSLLPVHNYRLLSTNMQATIAASDKQRRIAPRAVDFTSYLDLVSMNAWVDQLQADYPQWVSVFNLGQTYMGNAIRCVQLDFNEPGTPANPAVFIESGTHAREWIGSAAVLFVLDQLVRSTDPMIRSMADALQWHLVILANPDGYDYTRTHNRMWRKTLSPSAGSKCFGVDANRNYGYQWNTTGTSSDPCSDIYCGPYAYSEPESRSVAQYLADRQQGQIRKFMMYLSVHSFSQLIMFPYSWSRDAPDNLDDLQAIGEAGARGMAKRNNAQYTVGQISQVIYEASGSSCDVAYDMGIPLVYAIELRPKTAAPGTTGFDLPASMIKVTGRELMDSIVAMMQKANDLEY